MLGLYSHKEFFGCIGEQVSTDLFIGDIVIVQHKCYRLSKGVVTKYNGQIVIVTHTVGDSHIELQKANIVSVFKHYTDLVANETVNHMWGIKVRDTY